MEEPKLKKVNTPKRKSSKGNVLSQNRKHLVTENRKKFKGQIMPGNEQERTCLDKKLVLKKKARHKSKKNGMKQKAWESVIAKERFIKSKKKLKKLAGPLDPQVRSSIRFSYAMRKGKVIRNVQVEKPPDPTKQYAENDGSELSEDKVKEAVKALLLLLQDDKKTLFSEGKDIYLHISSFKIPQTSPREIRVVLPHSLLPDTPDICLFTSDLQKGRKIDHIPTLEHFKELLSKKEVTCISEVITLRQLKTEYDRFELKRALCNRFDMFLSDAKVCGHISHLLGKTFYDRKKLPVPIKLDAENLKERVVSALHKTSYRVTDNGRLFVLKVAHTLMTPEQICENIMAAVISLTENFPGGWNNVLLLMIKGAKSSPVPFYMSTLKDNMVEEPITEPLRPKAFKNRTGELDGIGSVQVTPEGDVVVLEKENLDEMEREIIEREKQLRWKREMTKRERKRAKAGKLEDDEDEFDFTEEDLFRSDSEVDGEETESIVQTKRHRLETVDDELGGNEVKVAEDGDVSAAGGGGINAIEAAYMEYLEDRHSSQTKLKNSRGKSKRLKQ